MANTEQKICSSKLQRLKPVGWGSSILGPHMKIRSLWNFIFGNQRFRQGQENQFVMVFQSRLSWSMGCLHEIPPAGLLNILNTAQMKGRRVLQLAHLLLNHLVLDVPEAALGRFFSCLADWRWITLGASGLSPQNSWEKNGKTGELGQDRLEVRWEAVMFLFNVVNLNVWLFLSDNLAKCFVGVVWLMFGLDEGRVNRLFWFYCMR